VPYERFTIRSPADVTTFVLLLVVGTALAQSARSPEFVVDHVKDQLTSLLGLAESRFEFGSLLSHPPRLAADGSVMAGHGRWDVEQSGLPEEVELRVSGNGHYYGRFLLKPRPGFSAPLQACLVAVSLADQAGRAFSADEAARSTR